MQIDLLGKVAGKDGYVAYWDERDEMDEVIGQRFYELNDNFETIREVKGQELLTGMITAIAGDNRGNFHIFYREAGDNHVNYLVLAENGKRLFETKGVFFKGFRTMEDGRVIVCEEVTKDNELEGFRLQEADLERCVLREIAALSTQTIRNETAGNETLPLFVTSMNSEELLWIGKEGVYLCDLQGEKARMVYRWVNHGIAAVDIKDVYIKETGTISVIYTESQNTSFLLLRPTQEKKEITTITFAVSPHHKEEYLNAVTYFNKKYPAYKIDIQSEYDETFLLTQLGAGEGPVIIDTSLTGFETLEKLWQPLDGFMEQSGLSEELYSQALEFGRIDEKTYGIVTNFSIRALLVRDEELVGWDYESFLNEVEAFQGAIFTYEYDDESNDKRMYFLNALQNGIKDNYYLNVDNKTTIFGTQDFQRVIRLAEKAKNCPAYENGNAFVNGEALCEIWNVFGVESLIRLRTGLGKHEYVTGYPTQSGAKYLLTAQSPIAIRMTATEEEKRVAYTFIKQLLSLDSAKQVAEGRTNLFSVRKDMLEIQFDNYEKELAEEQAVGLMLGKEALNREKEMAIFQEMMDNSVVQQSLPMGLKNIFDEEFEDYLNGRIPEKLLEEHLKSRVELYLSE